MAWILSMAMSDGPVDELSLAANSYTTAPPEPSMVSRSPCTLTDGLTQQYLLRCTVSRALAPPTLCGRRSSEELARCEEGGDQNTNSSAWLLVKWSVA